MNWKPALIGALVVIVAGFGVGVAVDRAGGSDPVTVARTVPVTVVTTVTAPGGPSTTTTDTTDTTPTVPDPAGRAVYLAELADEARTDALTLGAPSEVTIGHTSFENAITVDELWDACESQASIEYPTPARDSTFVADVGWTQESGSSAAARFELYKDRVEGPPLYHATFDGPRFPVHVNVQVPGAVRAILVWRRTDNDTCESPDGTFALGNARFVN
jgi:hypothetical protein